MSSKLFTTRQGTILLGVIAAVIATIALIVYLNQYRNSVNKSTVVSVLVAKQYIGSGTSGEVIGVSGGQFYETSNVAKANVKTGALVDPAALKGQVTVKDIYAGQQLTADDFGPATDSVTEQLSAEQRAVAVPLGSPQQVGGDVTSGSHVDVWLTLTRTGKSQPSTILLLQDAYVLGTNGGNATLRTNSRQAGQIIWGSENGQLWLALRPTVGKNLNTPPVIGGVSAGG
jgi:Flp pilus assembly protein CpaB